MMLRNIFYAFSLIFILAACSDIKLTPLSSDATILAFGDSLTHGVGGGKGNDYPKVLSELTGLKVINAGISGETTEGGLKRFESVLTDSSADLIILMEGGNDILRNKNLEQTKQNLSRMIEIAQNQGVEVILIGVPQKQLFSDSAPFYRELAEEHQLVFDGETLSGLLRSQQYKSDPIHLNAAGYRKFAERIHESLIEQGAL